mmetsp:Transcript_5181/g.17076  ORF Transcript_5181/g.17076 Transcript_5181/m.17076 type:complete len:234 (+) Transcript_5181:2139-2840(+)
MAEQRSAYCLLSLPPSSSMTRLMESDRVLVWMTLSSSFSMKKLLNFVSSSLSALTKAFSSSESLPTSWEAGRPPSATCGATCGSTEGAEPSLCELSATMALSCFLRSLYARNFDLSSGRCASICVRRSFPNFMAASDAHRTRGDEGGTWCSRPVCWGAEFLKCGARARDIRGWYRGTGSQGAAREEIPFYETAKLGFWHLVQQNWGFWHLYPGGVSFIIVGLSTAGRSKTLGG